MSSSVLTLDACVTAIAVAAPLMTAKKLEQFKHNMRIAYVQSNLDEASRVLALKVCPKQMYAQAQANHAYWTAHMIKLTTK